MVSEALQALYDGDRERADRLSAPDDELPVYEAAALGRIDRLRQLLDEDPANANTWFAGVRPLGTAAFVGRPDLEQILLDAGADPDLPREE